MYLVKMSLGFGWIFVQVASSEWALGVQTQHFENTYNAEMREGKYCCCDFGDVMCTENITELNGFCIDSNSINPCDSYFLIYIRDYYNSTCTATKMYRMNNDSTSLNNLVLYIPLKEIQLSNNVRIKNQLL